MAALLLPTLRRILSEKGKRKKPQFPGHQPKPARIARGILYRLGYSRGERAYVENLMQAGGINWEGTWQAGDFHGLETVMKKSGTPQRFRDDLIQLSRAHQMVRKGKQPANASVRQVLVGYETHYTEKRIRKSAKSSIVRRPEKLERQKGTRIEDSVSLAISSREIQSTLNLPTPGWNRMIRRFLVEEILANRLANERKALIHQLKNLPKIITDTFSK
jgi:hypothetical protein